ncbi:ABC transporter substrate-binding protein [Leekyejoonella antrihumi]|uniref:Transporter substrate-binding domain-containing protein n=1 Tax=Leekyejoonella antrihumi TaxID=1660198 RepID=A0A563DTF8_9MICO|nr:ABC transporter substrate-binding protein [Leekyejoonella antrihumi]TWP32974.1 transporter substrate-binding domain-containing protein [Leekyejoonella antrihumi]
MVARRLVAIFAVTGSFALASCSSGSNSGGDVSAAGSPGAPALSTLKVGVMPFVDVAPMYLGVKKGFYKDHGLRLDLIPMQSGTAAISAVMSGSVDFGLATPIAVAQARAKGLPIRFVAPSEQRVPSINGLVVKANSRLHNAKDLDGKTIALSSLKTQPQFNITAFGTMHGADPGSWKLISMATPDMLKALGADRIDAAYMAEPFLTQAKESGYRVIINDPLKSVIGEKAMVSAWFSQDKTIKAKPNLMTEFVAATAEANTYSNKHHDELRGIIPSYTKLPKKVVSKITLPVYAPTLNRETMKKTVSLGVKYGFVDKPVPVDDLVYRGK